LEQEGGLGRAARGERLSRQTIRRLPRTCGSLDRCRLQWARSDPGDRPRAARRRPYGLSLLLRRGL